MLFVKPNPNYFPLPPGMRVGDELHFVLIDGGSARDYPAVWEGDGDVADDIITRNDVQADFSARTISLAYGANCPVAYARPGWAFAITATEAWSVVTNGTVIVPTSVVIFAAKPARALTRILTTLVTQDLMSLWHCQSLFFLDIVLDSTVEDVFHGN